MSHFQPVIIRDAELREKLNGSSLTESIEFGQEQSLASRIRAQTGIPVVAKLNEATGCVEVKRILIG